MSDRRTIADRATEVNAKAAPAVGEAGDRRQMRHDAKRARIVAEAWELARQDGLAAISLRDLAESVDLRQPSLYAYFDSKLALYDVMFTGAFQEMLEAAAEQSVNEDPREALIEFVEFCIRFAADDVVRHQLMFQRTIPGFKPSVEARAPLMAFREIGWVRLQAVGITDLPTTDIFTGIVAGFTNQQVFNDPNGDRWLRQARRAVEMFLTEALPTNSPKPKPRTVKKQIKEK